MAPKQGLEVASVLSIVAVSGAASLGLIKSLLFQSCFLI